MKRLPATVLGLILFFHICSCEASPYFEAGTSVGNLKSGDSFFNATNAVSSGLGFIGSFSFYTPVTSEKRFWHLELGMQNRISSFSNSASQSFAMASPNIAGRLEVGRFYGGLGYAPFTYGGPGVTSVHAVQSAKSYFIEGGMIWRVIPEWQIALNYAMEFASPSSGSIATTTEYGLRFRFPLNPKEVAGGKGVDFDGFRYPFGIMK